MALLPTAHLLILQECKASQVYSTDHVLLVGMMGAGKSTVGRIVADRLRRPYVDSDEQVERATGQTVPEIFVSQGEAAFRAEEAKALRVAVSTSTPSVVSVAGGAILDPANRELVRRAGTVVWLRARVDTIVERVGDGAGRVLLQPSPAERVPGLIDVRYPLYEQLASAVVDVDDATPGEVADRVVRALLATVSVELPGASYPVVIGPGAISQLPSLLPERARRAAVVTQKGIGVEVDPGLDAIRLFIGDGESAKSLETVSSLCRAWASAGLTRHDVVIAVGGGVVTDAVGFAASCYHRGVDVVHVSTTLLGQVDAAVGGKTGVNLPEGKNLVGAFWQPKAVIGDTDTLATLPDREWRSGFGEMAKYAFLGLDHLDELPLAAQIAACVELKAEVVVEDEREGARRMLLNYGHTLAHALEAAGFAGGVGDEASENPGTAPIDTPMLRHGEAVGIGLVYAARLAHRLGRIDEERLQRHIEVVRGYGLVTEVPSFAHVDELVVLMGRDKKATDGLTFVLDGADGPEVVSGIDPATVTAVLAESIASGAASDEQ